MKVKSLNEARSVISNLLDFSPEVRVALLNAREIEFSICSEDTIPKFKNKSFLLGMMTLRDVLGIDELDITSHYKSSGCSTCDFGAEYTYHMRGWVNPKLQED